MFCESYDEPTRLDAEQCSGARIPEGLPAGSRLISAYFGSLKCRETTKLTVVLPPGYMKINSSCRHLGQSYPLAFACEALRGMPKVLKTEDARRPVSRVLSGALRPVDDHSSGMTVADHLSQPTRRAARKCAVPAGGLPFLFGFAPGGVYRAASVAGYAVRSYRTLSPLPRGAEGRAGGLLSVALSLGSPPPGVTRHPISVEPGLSSRRRTRRAVIQPSGRAGLDGGATGVKRERLTEIGADLIGRHIAAAENGSDPLPGKRLGTL